MAEAINWYTGAAGHVDDARARLLLERAAASQDTLAVMWIARVHSTGRMGFMQDRNLAQEVASNVIQDVERLANANVAEACFLMGTAFAEGLGKTVDPVAAARWYERAALLGNMLAQHNMGNIYASGTGVPQNNALAVSWWLQAAAQGDAIPQFRVAEMFERGLGVDLDIEQATRWYRESARRGYGPAQVALDRLARN
ncbi:MAG: tetratricopeptide repeat protein [Proteobacteria bacterium]|nr:tetratricopeptide repeat protein [Pseudomonadota bacterium]